MVQRLKSKFVKENIAIIFLLSLYLILSLYRLGDIPTPWYDEIVHLNTAWHISTDGHTWCDFYTDKFQENRMFNSMQLHWLILGLYVKLFGCSILSARLLHVILSLITLFLLYILASRILNKKIGLYSALFCASSFIFFHNSRQIMPQVPAALFSILAFLCFDITREKKRPVFIIAAGIFAAMSYLSHPIGLGTFFIIIALSYLAKLPIRFLFIYLSAFTITISPYWAYVMMNFQEYSRQTSTILKDVYQNQPLIFNILDEIPVRYFGLPPFRTLYETVNFNGNCVNTYIYRVKWMFEYLDLRIMFCEIGRAILFILHLVLTIAVRDS